MRLTSSQEFRHQGAGKHCHSQIMKVGGGGGWGGRGGRFLQGWVTGVGEGILSLLSLGLTPHWAIMVKGCRPGGGSY